MKLLTIQLDDEVYEYVKIVAKSQQVTMDDILLSSFNFVNKMTRLPLEQQDIVKDIVEKWT